MEGPTLKEAMDHYDNRALNPAELSKLVETINRMVGLYQWARLRESTYSDDGYDSYGSGLRDSARLVAEFLKNMGIADLCDVLKARLPKIGQEW